MKKVVLLLIVLVALGFLVYSYEPLFLRWFNSNQATTTPESKDTRPDETVSPKGEIDEDESLGINISPSEIFQGDPALITVSGIYATSEVQSFTFNNRPLVFFEHEGRITSLMGIDLRAATGTFPVVLTLKDGKTVRRDLVVKTRVMPRAEFGIPEKLGGNNAQAEKDLTNSLVQEAMVINAIPTSNEKLWSGSFSKPLENTEVTDIFGYTRLTGGSTFAHKGTDYRAVIGTPVYAMNSGVVRYTGFMRNYGYTVVIDHGLGLHTVYMHLSRIDVTNGQDIEKGGHLGLSGDTGYVLGPHLHVTVRIWDISVDPEKFVKLLQ